jgi:hypothetical protein
MKEIHALKEWQVTVDALERGDQILLLRKGGIREAGGQFSVQHDRVLLFPTYEHQKPHLLQSPYDRQVVAVAPGWHPDRVTLKAWAEVMEVFEPSQDDRLMTLMPFHIWNEEFINQRLQWKPTQTLLVILVRVYRLPTPVTLPYNSSYGGCKSWIDLQRVIDLDGSTPVLTERAYQQQAESIRQVVGCGKVV